MLFEEKTAGGSRNRRKARAAVLPDSKQVSSIEYASLSPLHRAIPRNPNTRLARWRADRLFGRTGRLHQDRSFRRD